MIREYFGELPKLTFNHNINSNIRTFFRQERDWTCSIACLRSLLSSLDIFVPTEEDFIESEKLVPGPHYAKDITKWSYLLGYDVKSSIDHSILDKDPVHELCELMIEGYSVMIDTMLNYDHWVVVVGIYPNENIVKSQISIYDPYYNKVRLFSLEEFVSMWSSGEHSVNGVVYDYIAIKKKVK